MHNSVLLVEDNPGDARLVRDALGEASDAHGHRLTMRHVHRLSEGIAAAGDNVDTVLLDLSLPDSQGLEGFIRLHTALPDLPIVILTGLRDESMAVDALQLGAQDYLSKSKIEAEVVGRSLRFALARKRAENRGMAPLTLRGRSVVESKAPSVREVVPRRSEVCTDVSGGMARTLRVRRF